MSEAVIERNPGEIRVAIREGGRTLDVHLERMSAGSLVGAVYLARATRIEPGVGVFLDIGMDGPAFLSAGAEKVVEGAALVVQVTKDATAGKGPEVTRAIAIGGGSLALTPMQPGIAVSRKLPEGVRKRLRVRLREVVGDGPGVLARSDIPDGGELRAIWQRLIEEWTDLKARLGEKPPVRLKSAPDPVLSLLQRVKPARIVVGDAATAAGLRAHFPDAVEKIERPFETLGVEDEIVRVIAREIPIAGGRLVVDEGEALTAIDVNGTGDRMSLCLAAAREVGRLIRLRDLGGTVVVDFPFLDGGAPRAQVEAVLKAAVVGDPQPVECLGWTRAGLYEMTRPRRGLSLAARLYEVPQARMTAETVGLAALRAVARATDGRLRLAASPDVIAWLQGPGAAALAEAGHEVALDAQAGYPRERFEVVRA